MHKYRIYELAKIYGKTSEEVIGILKKHQYEVSKAANSVDEKAKAVLDRELGAKDGKKAAKKPAFRTVPSTARDVRRMERDRAVSLPPIPRIRLSRKPAQPEPRRRRRKRLRHRLPDRQNRKSLRTARSGRTASAGTPSGRTRGAE